MTTYGLEAIQADLYAVLADVVRVLEAHELPYSAICGTLLGAVRHQAIIPWDDDVDLVLPRESFDRLMEVYPQVCGESFKLDVSDTWVPRVRKVGGAAFVDLFVLDPLPVGRVARAWKLFRLKTLQGMLKRCPEYHRFPLAKRVLLWATHMMGMLFPWETKLSAYRRIARTGGQSPWLHMSNGAYSLLSIPLEKGTFQEPVPAPFGQLTVRIPREAEHVLTKLYGKDYMTPPPEHERRPLHLDR